ncbi:MAG: hypothetical protein HY695_29725 [Deltaproteobacteria bacterium]|nr:hypothetical protein [Deltaproteobacteria bacterium]
MGKAKLKKEKWTLTFDRRLKGPVVEGAKRRGVYPVQVLLESLVRERLNPFGHTDIQDETAYIRKLRKKDKEKSDEEFLEEIRRWEKIKPMSFSHGRRSSPFAHRS